MSAVSPAGQGPVASGPNSGSVSPRTVPETEPKNVTFHLVFGDEGRARLPMRIQIWPHDTTESIVCTVKNFYGLYSSPTVSKGVSFEDERRNLLIARYENFQRDMNIYVRVHEEIQPPAPHSYHHGSVSRGYYSPDALPLPAPLPYEQHYGHGSHGMQYARSPSPNNGGRGRRSGSVGINNSGGKKGRSRSSKNRSQTNGYDAHGESLNGYSSGDGAMSSTSGIKKEHLGNTEISLENIVEGGRRKRPKFESSELPLFAPPQMPAATSNPSVSPTRRTETHDNHSMSYVPSGPNPFSNPRPTHSPHDYNDGFAHPGMYPTPGSDARRGRGSFGFPQPFGSGMHFQTPTATANSCMSEEDKDVAIQLMRLGEFSHGRTSASTMDDTFSGKADAASSTGATSDAESDQEPPPARRQKTDASGSHRKVLQTTESHFVAHTDGAEEAAEEDDSEGHGRSPMAAPKLKATKSKTSTSGAKPRSQSSAKPKTKSTAKPKAKKSVGALPILSTIMTPAPLGPISPASLPASRKQSIASTGAFSAHIGDEEQPDLSTKPRCQRCRKSKKGCDRQRPCARCKDAGIPADQCISEDEGNGRKGRYGRHMGVPIFKDEATTPSAPLFSVTAPASIVAHDSSDLAVGAHDKNKKRKR